MSKLVISPEQFISMGLPNPNDHDPNVAGDMVYYVRFRIISEDRNRLSSWSSIFKVSL